MASNKIDTRQITQRGAVDQLSTSTTTTELDNLISSINQEVTPPLRLTANTPANLIINVGAAIVTNAETNKNRSIPHVGALLPNNFAGGTITFPAVSGGNIVPSPGNVKVLNVAVGNYIKVLIYLDSLGALNVLPGAENAVEANATVLPTPKKTLPIGYVTLQNVGGVIQNISQTKIYQFGTGAGGGSGDGDANELLERLKDRVINAPFEWCEPNIFSTDEDDKISSATASYDIADTLYKYTAIGQNIVSIQSLDPEFLTEGKDVGNVELLAFWDKTAIDPAAVYEVSRNGGVDWETLSMSRVGSTTETFRGILTFPEDTSWIDLHSYPEAQALSFKVLDITTVQSMSQAIIIPSGSEQAIQKAEVYLNRLGNPAGWTYVQIIRDDGLGKPSTNVLDIVAQAQVMNSTLVGGNNTLSLDLGTAILPAGTYHYVISTDSSYKAAYSGGANCVRLKIDNSFPIGPTANHEFNGTVWTANASQTLAFKVSGRPLDLRVRVTSSASNVKLKGYGILYGSEPAVIAGIRAREVVNFDGTIDNLNEFTLSNFLPDPELLKIYHVQTGQVYMYGIGSFSLDGHKVIFAANTFNGLGTTTLIFDQSTGTSFDNSDVNAALMAANFLGSTDASIDRSQPGRGIFLRRPDGTLREITIDNSDNIVIYSV